MHVVQKRETSVLVAICVAGSLSLLSPGAANADWVPARNGDVPPGAIVAGGEANGTPLFICRARYRGGVHPGKVRPAFRGCNVPWGGKENRVNPYEVLTGFHWVRARGGQVPRGAISGGREADGTRLFLCRARYQGGIHPGKVRPAFGGCNVPWGGRENKVTNYEVLVRP